MKSIVLFAVSASLLGVPGRGVGAPGLQRLLRRGDARLAGWFGDRRASWRAIWYYRRADRRFPGRYGVLWRLARAHASLAQAQADQRIKSRVGQRGYGYALRAIRRQPDRVEGHFWAALCIGAYGEGIGIFTALRQGVRGKFVGHLERALRIDAAYDHGGPDRVFAMYHHALPWPLRSGRKSLSHFRRSLRHAPRHALTRYYLAEVLRAEDRPQDARRQLVQCVAIGESSTARREDRRFAGKCRRLLGAAAR